jgi:magnesium transporter
MIVGYSCVESKLRVVPVDPGALGSLVWLDLLSPSDEEEAQLEASLGVDLPTREEMAEIEQTSRLYAQGGGLFMTALIPANSELDAPIMAPVTFVLVGQRLVTIRYHSPHAFELFTQRATAGDLPCETAASTMVALLEVMIDRLADVLERVGRDVEVISRGIFAKQGRLRPVERDLRATLEAIGRKGDMLSDVRDSLGTLDRLGVFFGQRLRHDMMTEDLQDRLKDLSVDIKGLADHSAFAIQKVTFLLDATLGLISIEQNTIFKILSVVSVVFLPPTLVASIYGMNFADMPELSLTFGYPLALVLMLLSAGLPYLYFKRKGWL